MTTITNSTTTKKILSIMLATMMLLTFYSCAKKSAAVAKTEVPSPAETPAVTVVPVENKGQVQIKRDATGNYIIQINLKELKEINKLEPKSKKANIVWMNADNQKVKNLGQINSNSGWLSDKSKASFEAVSEFKPTKVFISEEDVATVTKPGIKIIWSTSRF